MPNSTLAFPTSKWPPSEPGHDARPSGRGITTGRHRLAGRVRRPETLTSVERDRMHALMVRSFANVTRARFEHDLAEKEWVILLTDVASGRIQGFSTLMRLHTVVDEQPVVAFFSGDTIIHRQYWGETVLPRLWARHVFGLADAIRDARVYWFLICSGYKTYRFLPLFFREFYPTYERSTPAPMKRVLDALARLKFPSEYDPEQGVVRLADAAPLRPGVAEMTARRLKDPHIAFFVAANPGHVGGDELVCVTELTRANLTAAGRRMLGA